MSISYQLPNHTQKCLSLSVSLYIYIQVAEINSDCVVESSGFLLSYLFVDYFLLTYLFKWFCKYPVCAGH